MKAGFVKIPHSVLEHSISQRDSDKKQKRSQSNINSIPLNFVLLSSSLEQIQYL